MNKLILGISIFWFGAVGNLITYTYTLLHPCIFNGQEGWLTNFYANDTGIPLLFFAILMVIGIIICTDDLFK